MKVITYRLPLSRSETSKCEACGAVTREGKPFCTRHITQMPYVSRLVGELKQLDLEVAQSVTKGGAERRRLPSESGVLVAEVIRELSCGAVTIAAIARRLWVPPEAVDAAVERLRRRRLVRVWHNKRGYKVVCLTRQGRE